MDVLEPVGSRLQDGHAGLARAGERDHADVGMAHERLADRPSSPVHDVEDARRSPASSMSST